MKNKIHIVITGPESSGKTTLWNWLKDYLNAYYIEEYARIYLDTNGPEYSQDDLLKIAFGQFQSQLSANGQSQDLIISDTCLLTIKIWEEYKFGFINEFIDEWLGLQKVDYYILCSPDLDWEEDPMRENKEDRDALFKLYKEAIEMNGISYDVVKGKGIERNYKAKELIKQFIESMK